MDAIQLVKQDHRAVEGLFKGFERAEKADDDGEMKRLVRDIVKELSIHAAIEEAVLYPTLRRAEARGEDDVLEALEEHHVMKLVLGELEDLGPEDERFRAKVTVLMESVRHHVKEEEQELLPRLRRAFAPKDLEELGELMAQAKRAAPTRPHPGAPDTPPGNLLAGALSAFVDRARDALRGASERGARAAKGKARAAARTARGKGREAGARGRAALADLRGEAQQPTTH